MANTPIETVIQDGVAVSKPSLRSYENSRNAVRIEDAATVQSSDLTGIQIIQVSGRRYALDTSDTTSAHDGDRVMVDSVGHRFIVVDGDSHGQITVSSLTPSGGDNGDIWLQY